MAETRTKRESRWLVAVPNDRNNGLTEVGEVTARTAARAAEEYRAAIGLDGSGIVVVYPLRPIGEPAFFSQTMMPVMVPCEAPDGDSADDPRTT